MEQRTYKCDGGYVRVRIGKRNFIYYHNGVTKGDCQVFKFESKDEFDEYYIRFFQIFLILSFLFL